MKTIANLFERFERLDSNINEWLVAHSIAILRVCLGLVFVGFGVLKFFPGISPIESLATRTTEILTFGLFTGQNAMNFVAGLECIIGVCFLTGRFLRVGVWLMAAQMAGAMAPVLLFPAELFFRTGSCAQPGGSVYSEGYNSDCGRDGDCFYLDRCPDYRRTQKITHYVTFPRAKCLRQKTGTWPSVDCLARRSVLIINLQIEDFT